MRVEWVPPHELRPYAGNPRRRRDMPESAAIETMLGLSANERERLETSEEAFLALMGGQDQSMT